MNLQSAIDAALAELRAEAESRMTSTCTVMRPGGTTTDADGYEVPEWAPVHTDLPCRLGGADQGGSGTRTTSIGGAEVQLASRVLSVPADTTGLTDGDLVEMTGGENTGLVLRVLEVAFQDQATARRLPVVETQRPEEWA
jgi:hypothetical protein